MSPPHPPKELILGVYGAFVRRLGGWVAVSHVITLLSDLGVDEQAVRSSTSRLVRRGMLVRERRHGFAGYALTPMAMEVLAEGDRRIYASREPSRLEDGWVIVVFSVPESQRSQRHVLRSRLVWLGFGLLAPGVWFAPARLREEAEAALARLGLTPYVDVFEARYAGFDEVRGVVGRAWDLAALAERYEDFLDAQRPVLRSWRESGERYGDRQAFADYLPALTQWRRLPFLDPGLPAGVLPESWPGHAASAVFHDLREEIEPRAYAWVRSVVTATAP